MMTRDPYESAWNSVPLGHRVESLARVTYDPAAMMFVEERQFDHKLADAQCAEDLSLSWLRDQIALFVRGRAEKPLQQNAPEPRSSQFYHPISNLEVRAWLHKEEVRRVYDGHLDSIVYGSPNMSKADRVATVLCDPVVGNRDNDIGTAQALVADPVAAADEARLPLRLLLPAFPFKDQNPFWTDAREDGVDLGEVGLLIRLHCLALALRQVCSFGVEIVVLSDGALYQPLFGVDLAGTKRYLDRIRAWRDLLNLRTTVKIVCLERSIQANTVCKEIQKSISRALREAMVEDSVIRERLLALQRSLLLHLESRSALRTLGRERLWDALCKGQAERLAGAPDDTGIWTRARETAIEYAAAIIGIKACRFYDWFAPRSIRMTVHAKEGQLGIPSMGEELPWNGVGVLSNFKSGPSSWMVECRALWQLHNDPRPLSAAVLEGTQEVVAYIQE